MASTSGNFSVTSASFSTGFNSGLGEYSLKDCQQRVLDNQILTIFQAF